MPISRDKWEQGAETELIVHSIIRLLHTNPDQAFAIEEIIEAIEGHEVVVPEDVGERLPDSDIESVTDAIAHLSDRQLELLKMENDIADLKNYNNLLSLLVLRGDVDVRDVNGKPYYRTAQHD